jgi:glycerol uptake facilitator protein
MAPDLGRRLLAEAIGTALLVVFGAGAVVAALRLGNGNLDYAGLGIIAFSFALVIAMVIYAFGSTSGAHINPAVTLSLAAVRRFPWVETVPYIAAQLAGAFAGGLLIVAIFGEGATNLNNTGGTVLGADVSRGQAIGAEALGTFLLVATIMALAVDRRAPAGFAGLVIGLSVACAIMVIGPLTGGSLNPARTFGPYLTTSVFGDSPPWEDFWVYVVGPIAGGAIAALVYDFVARPGRAEVPAAAAAEQGTAGVVEGRRVAPGEEIPVGARGGNGPRRGGRFQGTGGDIEGERD